MLKKYESQVRYCDMCHKKVDEPMYIAGRYNPPFINKFGVDICDSCCGVILKRSQTIDEQEVLDMIQEAKDKKVDITFPSACFTGLGASIDFNDSKGDE